MVILVTLALVLNDGCLLGLRGAAILTSRAIEDSSPRIPEMLTAGARIWIIMPSGKNQIS